jgi:hypothetical protein
LHGDLIVGMRVINRVVIEASNHILWTLRMMHR